MGALAGLLALPATAPAAPPAPAEQPSVVLALITPGAETEDFAALPGIAPGIASAGLSTVSAAQTYLDISQGNRIFTSLYPEELPKGLLIEGDRVPDWAEIEERSADAPGNLVPGLLAQTLEDAGVAVRVDPSLRTPALLGANRSGEVDRSGSFDCAAARCAPGVTVILANRVEIPALASRLGGEDMLIALERPPPPGREGLEIGIAGRGFEGRLTSDTTRTGGLVTSTDIGPTILERYGLAVPDEMTGTPIRAEGDVDAAGLAERSERMSVVSSRREPVVMTNLLIWLLLALVAIAVTRGAAARTALPLLALACVYLPLMLLIAAALDPSRAAERLIVALGAPLLAAGTLRAFRGYTALAVACALTVGAYAIDVLVGSPLTKLSLIGPNPAIGVRFFGIGNELEAAIAVLVPVGIGAALAAAWPGELDDRGRRRAALAFLGAGAIGAIVFAAGRFGADVGAAIVLAIGAAVAAAVVTGAAGGRRTLLLILAAPVAALAALAALDLALGGGAHLTSSVLEAGGAGDLGDVAERRLRLSAKSFSRTFDSPFLFAALAALLLALISRRRIAGWFEGNRAALAGLCGAVAATVIGTLANDSGAVLLMIGTGFCAACAGFAWAQKAAP